MSKWVQSDGLGKCLRCKESMPCKCYHYMGRFYENTRTLELIWEVETNGLEELLKVYEDETKV